MERRDQVRIGGASGFWGESDVAAPQLLAGGALDYLVFDYLAEITLSIMARARAQDPAAGYAPDFVHGVLKANLGEIARQGVRVISNAGGVNPEACAEAVRALVRDAGLDLKVAVVKGDDLVGRAAEFATSREMFSGEPFPDPAKIASINAYLGAFPIAAALERGADIVITGRCVDSAVTLGACIHAFGWARDDWDKLAAGSLAGHLIECGPQATGGNFTDWHLIADRLIDAGYPIAEVSVDGAVAITKPEGTGGLVSVGTVAEQMLYEIGDPQAYFLPDVVCDFSQVSITQDSDNRVVLRGAQGRPAPDSYKVSATYADGFRIGAMFSFVGADASAKARRFAADAIARAEAKLRRLNAPAYDETVVEVIGDGSAFDGVPDPAATDVTIKVAAKHADAKACGLLLKEATGIGLSTAPGLFGFSFGRPKPSPVVRLFSFLIPKSEVPITVTVEGETFEYGCDAGTPFDPANLELPTAPLPSDSGEVDVQLVKLAWARSGDKGNKANIGVMPRDPAYAPWICAALSEAAVAERFAHFLEGSVERFYLPGTGAINLLLHDVLGGGGMASLRNDPQGKAYAQMLLTMPVPVPRAIAEAVDIGTETQEA